ncbi:MAG: hypothetical protein KAW09_10860 [Thermoplasmata archaeon]|nr:hypothetical protein [Thermoplasmata archaeon]
MEPLVLGIVFTAASVLFQSHIIYIFANIFFGVAVLMIVIFRDPPRNIGKGIVSPADGKVVQVDWVFNTLSIKTGFFSVHVIRAPISGKGLEVQRFVGSYPDSDKERKGTETRIVSAIGVVRVLQTARFALAGVWPFELMETTMRKGCKIGTILPMAFVTVRLPEGMKITVAEGQKVYAGQSTIAKVVKQPIRRPLTK